MVKILIKNNQQLHCPIKVDHFLIELKFSTYIARGHITGKNQNLPTCQKNEIIRSP